MKSITSFSACILFFQLAALACSARLDRRASPPAGENGPILNIVNGLNGSLAAGPADPDLKILSRVPYDVKIGDLTLRITALKRGPFISSFNILPCMVDAMSTAFNAIWKVEQQHPPLENNEFRCSKNSLTLSVLAQNPPQKTMEYGDLIYLAKLLLQFQQTYRLPGISFDYIEGGQKTGSGDIDWNYAATSVQSVEQE